LGVLAWTSAAITLLGFAVAIWQIIRARRAADAARGAALDLARRVRSRELLAKLGDAHIHLEAARNNIGRGHRESAILCLELSCGSMIEAQEIAQQLIGPPADLQGLTAWLGQLTEDVTRMSEPITDDPDFIQLRLQLREASEILRRSMAQSRYSYDVDEG
jgi:hypothetical protein